MKKIISILFACTLISACSVNPTSLKQKEDVRYFEIKKQVVDGRNAAVERTLFPCTYKSIGSDNSGTYFIGEGKCVGVHIIDGNKSYSYTYKGGVWVPKAKRKNPKLFVINGSHLNSEEKAPYLNVKVVDALHPNNYSVENALGGAIGGAIVNSLTQAEIGNIQTISEIIDEETISLVENAMK